MDGHPRGKKPAVGTDAELDALLRAAYARALGDNPGLSPKGLNADGRSGRNHLWVQAALRF